MKLTCLKLLLFFVFITGYSFAGNVTIIDTFHYSTVLGEIRNYRIFLPPGYEENPQKRYPVIYYYHGWSQRYFGDTSHSSTGIDKGADNGGDNLANFVKTHDIIVVKPDGYNRRPDEDYYLRPYNVSPVETYRQFPLYFPELVNYIDASYRTIADRGHRAISGLSMGGFMTFWIAGKYPGLVSAAGDFCGSVEFSVGPRNSPVEYRHIDMYDNYAGVNVRLNYGDKDFIRYYHKDMNKVWTQVMDNYEYKIYDAAHSTCGLTEMYEFILETFKNPPAKPEKWGHVDVYPDFSVWGYKVSSDRDLPGFTKMENVNADGFRIAVREFLPDGGLMPYVNLSVTTAPIYEEGQAYLINDFNLINGTASQKTIRSDETGRLKIILDGSLHEIGITKKGGVPVISVVSFEIEDMPWATQRKDVSVSVKLLNKGIKIAENVTAELSAFRESAKIVKSKSAFGSIDVNETKESQTPFVFNVSSDSIEIVKFNLAVQDKNNNVWNESFEVPLIPGKPEIEDFIIADGREVTVADAGKYSLTTILGNGNGDGIANPGESIVLLAKDGGKLWRTFLYSSDTFINPFGMNIRESDNWGRYDHVGGSAKYSVPMIASDCPENHPVEFFAEYWLPDYPRHIIKRGNIKLMVSGKDETPPVLQWVKVTGDNTIQVKLYDGSKIQQVKATFTFRKDLNTFFEGNLDFKGNLNHIGLNDEGKTGDRAEGDNVFSHRLPEQGFGLFSVEIEATDSFGNTMVEKWPDTCVLH